MAQVQYENNMQMLVYGSTFLIPNGGGDVTGFSLPMMASTIYEFEFDVIFQSSGTGRGIGLGVNGPATPSFVLVYSEIPTSLTTVTRGMQRAYATATSTAAVDTATADVYARCYGTVSNGTTAGNPILWANKSQNGGTMNIMPNSVMRMWRVNPSN